MTNSLNKSFNIYTDYCPCNSGKKIIDCCYATIDTSPPGNKTGYSHPNCYARSLNDCSKTISKEHYISKSVLDLLESQIVEISGVSWLEDGISQELPKSVLASNILCQRHNEALSRLDAIAHKFFRFILGKTNDQEIMIVRGHEIERWMLKVYCGLIASGTIQYNGARLPELTPNNIFLETLFYRKEIPSGCGLLFNLEKGLQSTPGLIKWDPLIDTKMGVIGLLFQFEFFRLILAFGLVSDYYRETENSKGHCYHPNSILIDDSGSYRQVHFGWPDGKDIIIRNVTMRKV